MWRSVIDQPQGLICTKLIRINQLNSLLNSVEWDEALRDFDINSAWTYFSSKFDSFLKESIGPKKEKSVHHS